MRERQREKSGKANEQKESETKHRGNHCLLQTLPQSCISTSLPASIILSNGPFFTWTHSPVFVCSQINQKLSLAVSWKHLQLRSGRKDQHSSLNPSHTCLSYRHKSEPPCTHILFLPQSAAHLALTYIICKMYSLTTTLQNCTSEQLMFFLRKIKSATEV